MSATFIDAAGIPPTRWSPRWTRVLVHGALWGVAASVLESMVIPAHDGDWQALMWLAIWIAPGWSVVGMGLAVVVEWAGARTNRPALLLLVVLASALALNALWTALYALAGWFDPDNAMAALFPQGTDPLAAYFYQAWVIAFYGGLYVAAWRFNRRAERTREVLGQAEMARLQTEAMLGEAALQALRGHVDAPFLLRVMEEVEQRYITSSARADKLLVLLVAFLRQAMPGIRSGRSTLAGELRLLRAYAELWHELEPTRAAWTVGVPGIDEDLPFPPLLLLPVFDRLASTSAGTGTAVSVRVAGTDLVVRIDGAMGSGRGWLHADLAHRMRVGLSALFGSAWSMTLGDGAEAGDPTLILAIRIDRNTSSVGAGA